MLAGFAAFLLPTVLLLGVAALAVLLICGDLGHIDLLATALDALALAFALLGGELAEVNFAENLQASGVIGCCLDRRNDRGRLRGDFGGRGLRLGFRLRLGFGRSFGLRTDFCNRFGNRLGFRLGFRLDFDDRDGLGLRFRRRFTHGLGDRFRCRFRLGLRFGLGTDEVVGETGVLDNGFALRLELILLVLLLAGVALDDFLHLDVALFRFLLGLEVVTEFLFDGREVFVRNLGVRVQLHAGALLVEKVDESLKTDVELSGKFVESDFRH